MQNAAKFTQLYPIQTNTVKNFVWKKQDLIVETDSQYLKSVRISIWGYKVNDSQL